MSFSVINRAKTKNSSSNLTKNLNTINLNNNKSNKELKQITRKNSVISSKSKDLNNSFISRTSNLNNSSFISVLETNSKKIRYTKLLRVFKSYESQLEDFLDFVIRTDNKCDKRILNR